MSLIKESAWVDRGFRYISFVGSLTTVIVLSIYAYGGYFSRPLADDYCESVWLFTTSNLFEATWGAYNSWLNSYSILFFVQLTDLGGIWGFKLMSGVTIVFWVAMSVWLFSEIMQTIELRVDQTISFWLFALAVFVSLYQTPALYQILYWRTAMLPYTLPLAFFAGIAAFILWYTRQPYDQTRSVRMRWLVSALIIFVTGLGETTSALLVGLLFLATIMTWLTRSKHGRRDVLIILALALFFAVVCLLAIAFAPGTSARLDRISNPALYNPFELGLAVIIYTAQFLLDTLKVAPLTILVGSLISFGVSYIRLSNQDSYLTRLSSSQLWLVILIALLLMFVAIGFSFAPSAFVRSYPVARARFASHFVMNVTLILESGLLGILASRIRVPLNATLFRGSMLIMLVVLSLYPLYVSNKLRAPLVEYQTFAAAWDERDAYIRDEAARGVTDVVIQKFGPMGGVGEIKDDPTNWINKCAAQYYGLESIAAP